MNPKKKQKKTKIILKIKKKNTALKLETIDFQK